MAIASGLAYTGSGPGPLTYSHTIVAGEALVVGCRVVATSATATATYAGVSMIQAGIRTGETNNTVIMFYLLNPTSGINNVVITPGSGTPDILGRSMGYTGVGSFDTVNTGADTSNPYTIDITTIADNCWTMAIWANTGGDAMSPGTGSTARAGTGTSSIFCDSAGPITPAGLTSMSATHAGGGTDSMVIISLSPTTPTSRKTVNGLASASVKTVNGLAIASVKTINGLA